MGIVIDSNGVIDIAASTPGTYRITYTTTGSCPSSSFQDVTINALPTISIADATGGFCSGSSTTITTTVSAGTVFAWYKDDVLIVGQTGSTLTVTEAAEYKATVTDGNGCTSLLSNGLDIEEFDSPTVTIATVPGTTICIGDTATLTASVTGGTGTMSYAWDTSPVQTTQAISVAPTTTTTYTVTVMDGNGCTGTASQEITPSTNATAIASINNDDAMSFNGTDTYIGVDNYVFGGLTELTVSFWYNLNTISGDQAIVAKWAEAAGILLYHDDPNGWRFLLKLTNGVTSSLQSTILPATPNTWEHIAVTWKTGGKVKMYLNGTNVEESSTAFSGTSVALSDFNIGRDALTGANTRYFNGKLDELAVWDSALSSCDIKGIYEGSIDSNAGKAANLLDTNTTIPAPVYWNRMGDS